MMKKAEAAASAQNGGIIMRLSKRLAAGVLVAVLALSMTACGGTGGGNGTGGNPSSKPGQTPPSSGSFSSSSSSSSSGTSGSSSTTASTLNARSTKYFNRWEKLNRFTYKVWMQLTENGETTVSTIRIVTDGVRYSFQQWNEKGESDWRVLTDTKTKQTNYIYDDFVLRQAQSDSMTSEDSPDYLKQMTMSGDSRHLNMPMTVGTTMVDGTLYYSETYEESAGGASRKFVYCFDAGDLEGRNLRYILEEGSYMGTSGLQKATMKLKILENTETVDYDALRVPEGYGLMVDDKEEGTTPKDNYPN